MLTCSIVVNFLMPEFPMDSPEQSQSYIKWDVEDGSDAKSDKVRDNGDWDGIENRKHISSWSKKSGDGDNSEGTHGRCSG